METSEIIIDNVFNDLFIKLRKANKELVIDNEKLTQKILLVNQLVNEQNNLLSKNSNLKLQYEEILQDLMQRNFTS
jgi:hypothetical protein